MAEGGGAGAEEGDALTAALDTSSGENAGERRQAIQKVLEEALLSAGLSDLVVSGEGPEEEEGGGEAEEGKTEKDEDGSECLAVQTKLDESGEHSQHLVKLVKPDTEPDDQVTEAGGNGCIEIKTTEKAGEEAGKGRCIARVEWVDVTDVFTQAAGQLAPGELIQEGNFTLLEAMSAVELLDPKMDASMHWTSFRGYPKTVSEAVEKGFLQLDGHSPSKIIGIFDEVFACVATWLDGHTMAQTVFTCLFLLDTEQAEDLHVRSFSLAMVKVTEYMRECICRAGVYVEDDQQGVCFGFNMLNGIDDAAVFTALKESEERANVLARQSAHADRQRDKRKKLVSDETELLRAILTRIRFVRNLFGVTTSLKKCAADGIHTVMEHLSQCIALLPDIISSCPLGEKLDPADPLKLGFHPLINHNLLPPSYKPCEILPRLEALASLQSILTQLETVLGLGKLDSFKALHVMSRDFCTQVPTPNVFVRSIIVLVCMQSDRCKLFGSPSMVEMLKKDAREFCNPPSLNPRSPLFSSSQGKELTERFFGRTIHPMYELLRMCCQHRARQQEKAERVLDFLADLQHETDRIDHLHNELAMKTDPVRQHLACYSSWVLYHSLNVMIDYIVLGFEFGLYSPFEYHYVYWYLEYLYGWLQTAWKSANRLTSDSLPVPKGKKKGKKVKRDVAEKREREMSIVHIKRLVCIGLMRTFEALILDERIPHPSFEYGSEELCFHHRFATFASIPTPQLLTYQDYVKLAGIHNYQGMDINLYEAASRHFSTAKAALEGLAHPSEELLGLIKAVKTNIVIMNLAAKGHKKDSKEIPVLDYSHHRHFPVVRIS